MRSAHLADYRSIGQLQPGTPTPGSYLRRAAAFRDARRAGYNTKASLMYVYTAYKASINTQMLRDKIDSIIAQRTRNEDEAKLLRKVFSDTGRMTLYTERTNFEKLVQRSNYLVHIKTVFEIYKNLNSPLIYSDVAAPWRAVCGYTLFEGELALTRDITTCSHCGSAMRRMSRMGVRIRGDVDEFWCQSCVDAGAQYCEVSGIRFDSSFEFAVTDTGLDFCVEYCTERQNLCYYDDEDECWVQSEARGTELPGYHGAARPWSTRRGDSGIPIPKKAIGVELELGFKDNGHLTKFLRKHMRAGGRIRDWPFSIERDGSLTGIPGGCEIISDPLPLHEGYVAADAPWRKLLELLNKHGGQGWKHREKAGIHVNMDVRHVTSDDVFKFAVFISNCAALSKFIAGRKKIFGREYEGSRFKMYSGGYREKKAVEYKNLNANEALRVFKDREGGKYSPVNFRNNECLEVRIFGSNIKYEGFMACVEYCVAAMEYVQTIETSDVFNPILSSLFRHWLATKTKQYPNLCLRIGLSEHTQDEAFKTKLQPVKECA